MQKCSRSLLPFWDSCSYLIHITLATVFFYKYKQLDRETTKIERSDSCVKCRKAWVWYSSATTRASRYKIQEPPARSITVKSVHQTEGSNAAPATQLGVFAAAHGKICTFQCSITNLKSTVKLFLCICLGCCCN